MSDIQHVVESYLRTWNETDPAERRRLLEESWCEDAVYVDPLVRAEGRDAIDATIAAVQAQFPGLVFSLGRPVDAHHEVARFGWELGAPGAEALVVGFDVLACAEDGRIRTVHGFLDKVPTI